MPARIQRVLQTATDGRGRIRKRFHAPFDGQRQRQPAV